MDEHCNCYNWYYWENHDGDIVREYHRRRCYENRVGTGWRAEYFPRKMEDIRFGHNIMAYYINMLYIEVSTLYDVHMRIK